MVILIIIVLVVLIGTTTMVFYNIKGSSTDFMSFKEALDLTNLPIVTFVNNGIKLNFLLDTGSGTSHINSSVIDKLIYKRENFTMNISGMEGNKVKTYFCSMDIEYKGRIFEGNFAISNLDTVFNIIKKDSGVQVHGILGSEFFQKYKYILDFKELIAYSKK